MKIRDLAPADLPNEVFSPYNSAEVAEIGIDGIAERTRDRDVFYFAARRIVR